MTRADAIIEAAALVKDQANELACLQTSENWKSLPHNARVAVQREIQRLNAIAKAMVQPDERISPG